MRLVVARGGAVAPRRRWATGGGTEVEAVRWRDGGGAAPVRWRRQRDRGRTIPHLLIGRRRCGDKPSSPPRCGAKPPPPPGPIASSPSRHIAAVGATHAGSAAPHRLLAPSRATSPPPGQANAAAAAPHRLLACLTVKPQDLICDEFLSCK
uniref:Uncharacterized protein n=1 Tax=Oryza meridionalis TaxID=40149 RepID=A0A0E0DT31_9ORYZ